MTKDEEQRFIAQTSAIPKKNLKVAYVDEQDTLGNNDYGSVYSVSASVLDSDKAESYWLISKTRNTGREMKYKDYAEKAPDIIGEVNKLGTNVYSVTVTKPNEPLNPKDQRNIHRNLLNMVINDVAENEDAPEITFYVDENNKAKSGTLYSMGRDAETEHKKKIAVNEVRSIDNYGIQTADFIAGALGAMYNKGYSVHADLIRKCKIWEIDLDEARKPYTPKSKRNE